MADKLMALRVTNVTLVGAYGDFPMERGNCFSVFAADGNEYRIVNFVHENMAHLKGRRISLPIQIRALADNIAVIHDPRIPDEWYAIRFCETCCPNSLLPLPQALAHERQEAQGVRKVHEGFITINHGKRPVLMGPNQILHCRHATG
jgi:hypothetical protein